MDFELRGCPVNTKQLVQILVDHLQGRRTRLPNHSVCRDCKLIGTVCVTVARGLPCLGPVTQAGCGAICPEFTRGCYGCYGPAHQSNPSSLMAWLSAHHHPTEQLVPLLQNFNAAAPAFKHAAEELQEGAKR